MAERLNESDDVVLITKSFYTSTLLAQASLRRFPAVKRIVLVLIKRHPTKISEMMSKILKKPWDVVNSHDSPQTVSTLL